MKMKETIELVKKQRSQIKSLQIKLGQEKHSKNLLEIKINNCDKHLKDLKDKFNNLSKEIDDKDDYISDFNKKITSDILSIRKTQSNLIFYLVERIGFMISSSKFLSWIFKWESTSKYDMVKNNGK